MLYFIGLSTIIFNGVLFHRQSCFIEERFRKMGTISVLLGLLVIGVWTTFICYKILTAGQ